MPPSRFSIVRYLRAHPFSTMALCNIVGDACYLGFAFSAEGFVSLPKLAGALTCLFAHTVLLAYGDDRAKVIAGEEGPVSRLLMKLRFAAQRGTAFFPDRWIATIRRWPVGVSFSILALNGIAFLVDGLLRLRHAVTLAMVDQSVMGVLITLGVSSLAAADFVRGQRRADLLLRAAAFILGTASVLNVILAATTLNGFVILSVVAFAISNVSVYFSTLDKKNNK